MIWEPLKKHAENFALVKQMNTPSPGRTAEKAAVLENNLYKDISRLTGTSRFQFSLKRSDYTDEVILKALVNLMPRFNIHPSDFFNSLQRALFEPIPPGKALKIQKELRPAKHEAPYPEGMDRIFQAAVTPKEIDVVVTGAREIQGRDGRIEKFFFKHEKSPGQMLADGVINFKEINTYPTINEGEYLMFILSEFPGKPGLGFDGNEIIPRQGKPYSIDIGPGITRIEKKSEKGKPDGYFLRAAKTGVILIERNSEEQIRKIDIAGEILLKKLDYATGNIGTVHTCPIGLNVHVVCSGFKVRVQGHVEAYVIDGGQVITNDEAKITKAQPGSEIMAMKDITINSSIRTRIISEKGCLTIRRELVDSEASARGILFEKSKGMVTSSSMEAERLSLKGLLFSGETRIFFGHNLFVERKAKLKESGELEERERSLKEEEEQLSERLHREIKKLTDLGSRDPDLIRFIKPLLAAVQDMDYPVIRREMEMILKKNSTKVVVTVRDLFEALEKNAINLSILDKETDEIKKILDKIEERMNSMKLVLDGYLRRASTIKIFGGEKDIKNPGLPDFIIGCEGDEKRYIEITGAYSRRHGFEFSRQSG